MSDEDAEEARRDDPADGAGGDSESSEADSDATEADSESSETPEDDHGHGLPPEDLQYPEFVFEEGEVGPDGSFDLAADLDRDKLREWVEDLAGGLASHDVAVESPEGYVTLGVAPEGVSTSFDPDESGVGAFEFTVEMRAKAMFVADDPDGEKVGARGGKGFIPIEMLTGDGDAEEFRCYNWMDDSSDP
ncbi:hypothetical protein M0R88_08725 [Halorussus gelatinilyticus]|uniref:Amphi-Trp domain-containing protein n=1 Tax=Halorussus gelatinilyticus TaxID=2937524 RepID=A0A8U0ILZ9_9EURY|nr:hypothetical protein [Halorussus gelatinilyticus]UPW02163.1 hypothetical protein M0R88_08725 [Halorussus gelatinilyticus]